MNVRRLEGQFGLLVFALSFCALSLSQSAFGDEMDHLFSQHRTQHGAGNYRTAEWIARQMIANANTDGWRAASYNLLGQSLGDQGRSQEAIDAYAQAMRYPLRDDNVNRGWVPNNLAIIYFDVKDYATAERYFQQARAVFEPMKGAQSSEMATIYMNLGNCCKNTGRLGEAESYYLNSQAAHLRLSGEESRSMAFVYANLGDLRRRQKRFDEAQSYLDKALDLRRRLISEENPSVAWTLHMQSELCRDQAQFDKAAELSKRALGMVEKVHGTEHRYLIDYLEVFAAAADGQNKKEEAEAARQRIAELERKKNAPPPPYKATVQVISDAAYVQGSGQSLATVRQGQKFDVIAVNGPWVGVSVSVGNEKKTGWLKHLDVMAVAVEGLSTELRWATLKPQGAGAAIEFPGSPKRGTQTVNGVEHTSYELSAAGLTYVFGSFDLPAGTVLAFDAAINAYATARKGTVQSERTVSIDDHAGKEFTVKMADGSASRMRLLAINRRWYQLVVEGNATAVAGANADRFMESFKLE